MKCLAPLLLCGCAEIARVGGGLELQQPKPEAIAFELGAMSIACLSKGLLLTAIVVEGDTITAALCEDPPLPKPGRSI